MPPLFSQTSLHFVKDDGHISLEPTPHPETVSTNTNTPTILSVYHPVVDYPSSSPTTPFPQCYHCPPYQVYERDSGADRGVYERGAKE